MTLRNTLFTILFIAGSSVFGQDFNSGYTPYTGSNSQYGINQNHSDLKFNLQSGASFSTGFGGGGLFNTFLAPSFSQNLGKKFTLSAGMVMSNTTYNNLNLLNQDGTFRPYSGNMTNFTLYAAGSYQVNERLTLSGSAYKTINPAFNARLNPDQLRMDAQGMSFGVGYKVGENMHIGAEIRIQQGNSNFYSPYGIPGGSPFNNGFYGY